MAGSECLSLAKEAVVRLSANAALDDARIVEMSTETAEDAVRVESLVRGWQQRAGCGLRQMNCRCINA